MSETASAKMCPFCKHEDQHYFSIARGSDKLGCQHEGCRCEAVAVNSGWYRFPSQYVWRDRLNIGIRE